MIYLVLSIALSTIFASCYKLAAVKQCNLGIVNVWLYAGSAATILAVILFNRHLPYNPQAALLGIVTGVMFYFATLTFFEHMKYGQLSASWTVISLSVAFPILASIFLWHEMPSTKQDIGLLLIVVALLLFGKHETKGIRK